MSVQTSASRLGGKTVGAAVLGLIVTLAVFVTVVVVFLLAPLVLFGLALVAYAVLRPRGATAAPRGPVPTSDVPAHDFGAGTR